MIEWVSIALIIVALMVIVAIVYITYACCFSFHKKERIGPYDEWLMDTGYYKRKMEKLRND